jgi:ligand-binding sensor domain-containing protein
MVSRLLRPLLALLSLWCGLSTCHGERYTFDSYADGLGNLNVRTMVQDRAGYFWLGTENGIYRFDGARFRKFGIEQGLTGILLIALHLDRA